MFGHKEKAAIESLSPQHQALLNDHQLAVTQSPAQWAQLFADLVVPHPVIHRHHLPPRLLDVVVPIIRVISEDVDPMTGIGVRLDLRGAGAPGKTVAHQDLPTHGSITKLEQTIDWDPWLVVDTDLRNDFHLDVSVIDVVRTHNIRKRSASGKTKHKTKAKGSQRVVAKLTTPKGRGIAPPAPSPATSWMAVTAKPKGSRYVVTAQGKYAVPSVPTPGWQVNTVLLVLAELFRWVAPDVPDAPEAPVAPVAPTAGSPA